MQQIFFINFFQTLSQPEHKMISTPLHVTYLTCQSDSSVGQITKH